jgi:8-oxo-dGTP pyrophosphatase MutT (NUDIX family)
MAISQYLKGLRNKIGHDLLLLPGVAGVVKNSQGEILFQKKPDGTWSLPAGMIEPDEDPMQALTREVFEETGAQVEIVRLLGVFGGKDFTYTYNNGDVVQYTVAVFECRLISDVLQPMDDETAELQFFTANEKPRLELPYPDSIFGV